MAHLTFEAGPANEQFERGEQFFFSDRTPISVGCDLGQDLHLKHSSVAKRHALIYLVDDGSYHIHDLGSRRGTSVDGQRLGSQVSERLTNGCLVAFGQMQFVFTDHKVPKVRALREWWDEAEPAPSTLTSNEIDGWSQLSGTLPFQTDFQATVAGWYSTYRNPQAPQSCLPVAIPYLIDLGALLVCAQPPLRSVSQVPQEDNFPPRLYWDRHLSTVAYHPAVRSVRERLVSSRSDRAVQQEIVARFLWNLFNWVAKTWFDFDAQGDTIRSRQDLVHCSGSVRMLTKPDQVRGFLSELAEVMQHVPRAFDTVLERVQRFLLGARPYVATAFTNPNLPLLDECLRAQHLEDDDFTLELLRLVLHIPDVPSRNPGDRASIVRVRKTTRLEDSPEVLPQEWALARIRPDGKRLLLGKLTNEGLLRWDRQHYTSEHHHDRFLVCFVADVGPYAAVDSSAQHGGVAGLLPRPPVERQQASARATRRPGNTPRTHAQRLIFESLRDMSMYIDLPKLVLDLHVFLKPIHAAEQAQWSCALSLDELRERLGKTTYDDMVELERRAPGYFFQRLQPHKASGTDYLQFIHRVFDAGDYDVMLFIFFAPRSTFTDLLPKDPPPPRRTPGVRDIIKLVRLGHWPTSVESMSTQSFVDATVQKDFGFCADQELRYSIIEDLLGPRRLGARHAMAGKLIL